MTETRPTRREAGMTLIVALMVTFLLSLLGASLLFRTEVELKTSTNNADLLEVTGDLDNAVGEIVYRLNLEPGPLAPPDGSPITVNGLSDYDAAIDPDPWDLLTNEEDDDGDGLFDEPDELNFNRDWRVRILLTDTEPNLPSEVVDLAPLAGPPWGHDLVEATIQPQAGWREYSAADVGEPDVLTIRFKLDVDTTLGDSEGDGPEIVFFDRKIATDGVDDPNTLSALGGDGDPATDSPYNITWSDGVTTFPAVGAPVLLLETAARTRRGNKVAAEKRVHTEITYPVRQVMSKAVCGCADVNFNGTPLTDSYRSSLGPYGAGGNQFENGDIGSNGDLIVDGTINGGAEAGGSITGADSVLHDAVAGGSIGGTPGDDAYPNTFPPPEPCDCEYVDVDAAVAAAELSNDNAGLPVLCQGPRLKLKGSDVCTLPCGTYFYETIAMTGTSTIIADSSCGPVFIYTSGSSKFSGNGIVHTGRPEDLQIISSVVGPSVDLGGTSDFVGVVYAPDAELRLHGTTDYYGAVLGRDVTNMGNPVVHYDEDLGRVWQVAHPFAPLAWLETD